MDAEDLEIKRYSLEKWKALASFLTPIVLVILTFQVNSVLKEKEARLRSGEQILREKQFIYSDLGKKLNIVYIYIGDIGDFRQYKPLEIIQMKRDADRAFFMYLPYWSEQTETRYKEFMGAAFSTFNGAGIRAKINGYKFEKISAYKVDNMKWDSKWDTYFTEERDPEYFDKYYRLVETLIRDTVSTSVRQVAKP